MEDIVLWRFWKWRKCNQLQDWTMVLSLFCLFCQLGGSFWKIRQLQSRRCCTQGICQNKIQYQLLWRVLLVHWQLLFWLFHNRVDLFVGVHLCIFRTSRYSWFFWSIGYYKINEKIRFIPSIGDVTSAFWLNDLCIVDISDLFGS